MMYELLSVDSARHAQLLAVSDSSVVPAAAMFLTMAERFYAPCGTLLTKTNQRQWESVTHTPLHDGALTHPVIGNLPETMRVRQRAYYAHFERMCYYDSHSKQRDISNSHLPARQTGPSQPTRQL